MIKPHPNMIRLALVVAGFIAAIEIAMLTLNLQWDATVITVGIIGLWALILAQDAWSCFNQPTPIIERSLPHSAAIGRSFQVHYTAHTPSPKKQSATLECELWDHMPFEFTGSERSQIIAIPPQETTTVKVPMHSNQRGSFAWDQLDVYIRSPLGLWQKRVRLQQPARIKVYPDFKAIQSLLALALTHTRTRAGVRHSRRRGSGQRFHQLREFQQGDSLRQVDWKASSRQCRMISKEYQEEQDQHIHLLLDCGRRMRSHDGDISHFDGVLNAVLTMGFTALRQGDRVSMTAFAANRSPQSSQLLNARSPQAIHTLLNQFYDLQPSLLASDYLETIAHLDKTLKKRSLVVITTTLRSESLEQMTEAVIHLRRRHEVIIAHLEESLVSHALTQGIHDMESGELFLGACQYQEELSRATANLETLGCHIIKATPDTLAVQLVQHYYTLKRSGKL